MFLSDQNRPKILHRNMPTHSHYRLPITDWKNALHFFFLQRLYQSHKPTFSFFYSTFSNLKSDITCIPCLSRKIKIPTLFFKIGTKEKGPFRNFSINPIRVHWLSSYSDNVGYCRFLPKFLLIFHPRKISFRIIFTQNLVTIVNFRPGFYRALGAWAGEGGLGNQWGGWGAYSD